MAKGDVSLFRGALLLAGFLPHSESYIFNDYRKTTGFRRLKLWAATWVFEAEQAQQQALEKALREAFGDRILSMYFVANVHGWTPRGKSLCIRLRD